MVKVRLKFDVDVLHKKKGDVIELTPHEAEMWIRLGNAEPLGKHAGLEKTTGATVETTTDPQVQHAEIRKSKGTGWKRG